MATYKGTARGGPTAIQVARTRDGLTISVKDAAEQPLRWLQGLTFRQGGILLTFMRANESSGPVTELRYDTDTEHSILERS